MNKLRLYEDKELDWFILNVRGQTRFFAINYA